MSEEKFERILIPFFGDYFPKKAKEKAIDLIDSGGELYLLHIVDEAASRSIRYTTGQLGKDNGFYKSYKESLEELQEMDVEEFVEKIRAELGDLDVSIESIFVSGDPAQETLKAIEKHSIDVVIVERLRERMAEFFLGEEIELLKDKAPCRVIEVS